ncbi:MAG: hypothetical protein IJL90_04040 [Lachnospiraceae bacterium]|nr:hypothetical protein [Lachnospiraceae bacterium]MBR4574528.1 hypothetical protein [Lachnospiraceae bacterium]
MLKGIDNLQTVNYNVYNRINSDPAREAGIARSGADEQQLRSGENKAASPAKDIDLRLEDIRPRKNASLEDVSLSLNEPNGFAMKGRESDLASLDMEKAVSDMQKDQALMQYQYFVGDTNIANSEDGIVIQK